MVDLEKHGISGSQISEAYGAIELDPRKASNDVEKLPLFLGMWSISPERMYKIGLIGYVLWFALHRLADVAYILTVDARFPAGLGHLYPSEEERLHSVSYTRQVLVCGMLHRMAVFTLVFTFIYFQLFASFDVLLRSTLDSLASWMQYFWVKWCAPIGDILGACCSPVRPCFWFVFRHPFSWCVKFKDHTLHGRLARDVSSRVGFRLSIYELCLGSIYLTLIAACFFLLSVPFMYTMQMIDLKFGFANPLNVSAANFRRQVALTLPSLLIWGVPKKFAFLAVLQYRFGWVLMWIGPIVGILYAQYNVQLIAPMLGMNNKFPTGNFAVGRGFPWTHTEMPYAPWISLNRIYFPDPTQLEIERYFTMDKSTGQLALMRQPSGRWIISGNPLIYPAAAIYAQSGGAPSQPVLDGLPDQSWSVGGPETRMGMRSGKELRDKLFGFAKERQIGVGNIYMVDGSHEDPRGNAFVTGAGNHSIIGLYDTLFLGQRGSDADEDAEEDKMHELAGGTSLIQHVSEAVQDVDVEQEDQDRKAPRNSAPTQAMSDDEIVSILAHELAHSAMRHMEQGMAAQAFTSFVTFATLGWMAQSPLAAAALSLSAPILHVGACAYEHVVGPPVEGLMKLFTDGLTRHNEYEADAYAARISEKYATALQTSLAKLSVNSNQDPDVPFFFEALHADHPTFGRRWAHIENVKKETYGK